MTAELACPCGSPIRAVPEPDTETEVWRIVCEAGHELGVRLEAGELDLGSVETPDDPMGVTWAR